MGRRIMLSKCSNRYQKVYAVICTVALLMTAVTASAHECRRMELEYPQAGQKISEPQPQLRWKAVPGITSYRVQLQARTPEAGVDESVDTIVAGGIYRVPRALTRTTAAVKLIVSANCPALDQQDLEAESASFFVDATSNCPMLEGVSVNRPAREIRWTNSSGHVRVEAAIYRADDGRLLDRKFIASNSFPWKFSEAAVVYLRPSCTDADGPSHLVSLPALLLKSE